MSAGFTVPTLPSMREALALGLLTLCLAAAKPAWGQEVTADITGSVVDPTGASIVGANITAKDTERQTAYTVLLRAPRLDVVENPGGSYRKHRIAIPALVCHSLDSALLPCHRPA